MHSKYLKYAAKGWVCIPGILKGRDVSALRNAVKDVVSCSRQATSDTVAYDLALGHSIKPALRKIKRPHLWHPEFNRIVSHPGVLNVVEDLLYPPETAGDRIKGVRFHGDKVVIKQAGDEKSEVYIHQDWAYYPHTNDDLCTVSVVLQDMTLAGGGLVFGRGSHRGKLYSHSNEASGHPSFAGTVYDEEFDARAIHWDAVECPAGSIVVHHARVLHGSLANHGTVDRPLLLLQYAAADAWPLQQHTRGAWGIDVPANSSLDELTLYERGLVRGQSTTAPRMDNVPVELPIPWPGRGNIGSLYKQLDQKHESAKLSSVPLDQIDVYSYSALPITDVADMDDDVENSFSTLRSLGGMEWERVMRLVCAGPYGYFYESNSVRDLLEKTLVQVTSRPCKDDDVYDALHECFWTQAVKTDDYTRLENLNWQDARIQTRAMEVTELIQRLQHTPVRSILDVGCADGRITSAVGEQLGCDAENVHGCDTLSDLMTTGNRMQSGFTFTQVRSDIDPLDERFLAYQDGQFDVVISLMSLHHIRHCKAYFDEIFRILRCGGLLLFREHHCSSSAMARALDILHGLHFRAWAKKGHPNLRERGWLKKNYEGYYQSLDGWHRSVTAAGFTPHPDFDADTQFDSEVQTNPKGVFFGAYIK